MRTIKIVRRNHIFSPLGLIKAVHKTKRMCHGKKELAAGFTTFYQALLIIMHIRVVD